jgi:hypothetical protein
MSKLERFDYLSAEAKRLRAAQRAYSPISREWLSLEMQIAGCIMLQAEC